MGWLGFTSLPNHGKRCTVSCLYRRIYIFASVGSVGLCFVIRFEERQRLVVVYRPPSGMRETWFHYTGVSRKE